MSRIVSRPFSLQSKFLYREPGLICGKPPAAQRALLIAAALPGRSTG
jgi:hypothetical protein